LKAGGAVVAGGTYFGPTLHPATIAQYTASGSANHAVSGLRDCMIEFFISNTPKNSLCQAVSAVPL
jgi:hypothetical protein